MAVQYIRDRNKRRYYIYAYKGGPRVHVHEGPRKPKTRNCRRISRHWLGL